MMSFEPAAGKWSWLRQYVPPSCRHKASDYTLKKADFLGKKYNKQVSIGLLRYDLQFLLPVNIQLTNSV